MTRRATPDDAHPARRYPCAACAACNLFRDAANRIHDDAAARQYGYAGDPVAGVIE